MRRSKNYCTIIVMLIALFTTSISYSQGLLQGDPSEEIEERARETTNMYMEELALTGKQAALMEKKIIEFAMKREELLNSKMNEEAKKEKFLLLEREEQKEMRNILTKPQFEQYIELQQELPIEDEGKEQ